MEILCSLQQSLNVLNPGYGGREEHYEQDAENKFIMEGNGRENMHGNQGGPEPKKDGRTRTKEGCKASRSWRMNDYMHLTP